MRRPPKTDTPPNNIPNDPTKIHRPFGDENDLDSPKFAVNRLVTRVFEFNPEQVYEQVDNWIRIPLNARDADEPKIRELLSESSAYLADAHRLYALGVVELEAYEIDARTRLAAIRDPIRAAIIADNKSLPASERKSVTDKDIETKLALLHADEWRDIEVKRARFAVVVDQFKHLVECVKQRCRALDALKRT